MTNFSPVHLTLDERVSPNAVYKLVGEVNNIVRSHNYTRKHGQKVKGEAVRELGSLAHVVSSFQPWTVCDEHELLYEYRYGGYPLHLQPSQRKWMCCCSVVWGMISNEAGTESSKVLSGALEPGGTCIFQSHN
ncbi:hypothetical protein TNCV_3462291 [Trichonephila clavipes]|nr:hypothetical protein TNCV_3462291 [Trichonephila clavipes]